VFARSNLHEYKSIWNAVIRQVQHAAWIQHHFTASSEEQTTLQALHVVVHNIKGLQQLLTDRIQSAAAGWQTQTRFLSSHDAP